MNITTTRLYCGKRLISWLCTVYRDVSGHLFIYFRILLFSSVDCDLSVWLIFLVCGCMCEYSCGGQKSTLGAILLVPPTSFIFLFHNIYLFIYLLIYLFIYFLCTWVSYVHICLCITLMPCCHGDQKRALTALELELTLFVSYHVGAKSNLSSLEEQSTLLTAKPSLLTSTLNFVFWDSLSLT